MDKILKGNFKVKRDIDLVQPREDLTDRFEKEALKRLGGSIAFVSKKDFLYGMPPMESSDESNGV